VSTEPEIAVGKVVASAQSWARRSISSRIELIDELRRDVHSVALDWARASAANEGLAEAELPLAEKVLLGPYITLRYLRLLRASLEAIDRDGHPRIPGGVRLVGTGSSARTVARVMPGDRWDWSTYPFVNADVWMQPEVELQDVAGTQALAYRNRDDGGVAVVLGAGNVTSIAALDVLGKLFIENRVVVLKLHPATSYLAPILNDGFRALISAGALRVLDGDAAVGDAVRAP
jgi:hypothetical protein